AVVGVLIITPITGHAAGAGSNLRPTDRGPASNIVPVWDGRGSGGHSGAMGGRPTSGPHGMEERVPRLGGRLETSVGGVTMAGCRCRLTGSAFLGVQSSIIPSRTGEARRAGGAIRSCWHETRGWSVTLVTRER